MKKLFLILVCLFSFVSEHVYWSYSIYYWVNQKVAKKTFTSDLVILQEYNFDLYKKYTWKKICYLSVWELDETNDYITLHWLKDAVISKNTEWNSFIMDMNNPAWIEFVLDKEKKLKDMWCDWLFLDTIWQENKEQWGIDIVKKIRDHWYDSYIIVNNAHYIKNEIKDFVDGYMFENFWDYGTVVGSENALWYESLFKDYSSLSLEWKKLYALNYTNPKNLLSKKKKDWYKIIQKKAQIYNFDLIFSSYNLDKVY